MALSRSTIRRWRFDSATDRGVQWGFVRQHHVAEVDGPLGHPDGPVALAGATIGPFDVKPGFHVTQTIQLTAPVPGTDNRRLYLVMESLKDNATVFREDRVYFNVATTGFAAATLASRGTAKFLGFDDQLQGDWHRKYGAEGFELIGDESKLPAYASIHVSEQAEARVVDATWRGDAQNALWTWAAKSDRRALARPSGTDRLAACWYGDTIVFDLEVGESSRNVTMYFVDWDQQACGSRRCRFALVAAKSWTNAS